MFFSYLLAHRYELGESHRLGLAPDGARKRRSRILLLSRPLWHDIGRVKDGSVNPEERINCFIEFINIPKLVYQLLVFVFHCFAYVFLYPCSVRDMLRSNSIAAIIGPYHPLLQLVADDERIPYITTSMSPEKTDIRHTSYCYHIMPSITTLNDAMTAIMETYKWEHTAVIYNKPEGKNSTV